MAANYYLANGSQGNATTLVLDNKGKLTRQFPDISSIDLLTMQMPYEDVKNIIQSTNQSINLGDEFFAVSFPHKQTQMNAYAPIFDYSSDKTKKYLEKLREFAEQRDYKVRNNQKIALDEDAKFKDFLYSILNRILSSNNSYLTDYDALVAKRLKDIIEQRDDFRHKSNNDYIRFKYYVLRNMLTNYKTLRNFTLTYLLHENNLETNIRNDINNKQNWSVDRMDDMIQDSYEQLDFFDLIEEQQKIRVRNKKDEF